MNRMFRFATISLAATVFLLMTGCERRAVTSDYFPMRDGNHWTYRLLDARMLERLQQGKEVATATEDKTQTETRGDRGAKAEIFTLETDAPKQDNPRVEEQAGDTTPTARRIVLALQERHDELTYRATWAGAEQVWSKRDGYIGFQNANGRHYLLILPPHTGYRWIVTNANNENLYYEIEGHQQLTTPAGIFRFCAVVRQETRDRRISFRFWFAEGVGLIRRSKYYMKEEVFRQELVEFLIRPSTEAGRRAEEREIQRALKGKRRGKEFFRKSPARQEDE